MKTAASMLVVVLMEVVATTGIAASSPVVVVGGSNTHHHDLGIVIGNDTNTRYPFLVSLQTDKHHFCGGTIIAPNVVITAWHCVNGKNFTDPKSKFRVVAGTNDLKDGSGQEYNFKRVAMPTGDFAGNKDISMIQVDRNFELVDGVVAIAPIMADSEMPQYKPGSAVIEVGWGRPAPQSPGSPRLREAHTFIQDNKACTTASGLVCMDARACSGDSGGPLLKVDADSGKIVPYAVAYAVSNDGPCFSDKPNPNAFDMYVRFDTPSVRSLFANLRSQME